MVQVENGMRIFCLPLCRPNGKHQLHMNGVCCCFTLTRDPHRLRGLVGRTGTARHTRRTPFFSYASSQVFWASDNCARPCNEKNRKFRTYALKSTPCDYEQTHTHTLWNIFAEPLIKSLQSLQSCAHIWQWIETIRAVGKKATRKRKKGKQKMFTNVSGHTSLFRVGHRWIEFIHFLHIAFS